MDKFKAFVAEMNKASEKFEYKEIEVINYRKGEVTMKLAVVKAYKKGTKRVFFAPITDHSRIGLTNFGRKGEAVNRCDHFARQKGAY